MYEKAIRDNFKGVFGVVQPQSGRVFTPCCNNGRNMDLPQHTGNQAAVETVCLSG